MKQNLHQAYRYYSMVETRLKFKEFIESFGAGSLLTSDQTGSEGNDTMSLQGHPVFLPSLDMVANNGIGIPQTDKIGILKSMSYKTNPIVVELDCGTKIFLSKDQYDRCPGDKPFVPKYTKIYVTFQRHPSDLTMSTSQISKFKSEFIGPDYLRNQYKIKTTPGPFTAF